MSDARRVLKWAVPVDDRPHEIGAGPVVLVACQDGPDVVQVWTDESAGGQVETRSARVYGTGQYVPAGGGHLGSVTAGSLVWHVFGSPWVTGHDAKRVGQ